MSVEELVAEKLKGLPAEKQKEVLDFVEFLRLRSAGAAPRRSVKGLWADLNIELTKEDIAEARREMWGNFPKGALE